MGLVLRVLEIVAVSTPAVACRVVVESGSWYEGVIVRQVLLPDGGRWAIELVGTSHADAVTLSGSAHGVVTEGALLFELAAAVPRWATVSPKPTRWLP